MVGKWHLGQDMPGKPFKRDVTEPVTNGPKEFGFDQSFWVSTSPNGPFQATIENEYCTEPVDMWSRKFKGPGRVIIKADRKTPVSMYKTPYTLASNVPKKKLKAGTEFSANFDVEYLLSNFTDHALGYIDTHMATRPENPFFLYFASTVPHLPVVAHPDFAGKSEFGLWADMLEELDFRAGQIIDAIEAHGVGNNTLFVWTSDNGPEGIYRRLKQFGYDSVDGLRGNKRSYYEGGHRVPMIMRWPDRIAPGTTLDMPVSQVDFFATFASLANITYDNTDMAQDSISFALELLGETGGVRSQFPLVAEDKNAVLTVRVGDIKFVPEMKLCYNLTADLSEEHNLWNDLQRSQRTGIEKIVRLLTKKSLFLSDIFSVMNYEQLLDEPLFKSR